MDNKINFPKYLSPSSFQLFRSNRSKYFEKYMAGWRKPNRQTQAMAVGSGFDAMVKNELSKDLGLGVMDLFEDQVDPEWHTWCRIHARIVFDFYYNSGAYRSLLNMLEKSIVTPQFEFKLTRVVNGVPILGYPDVYFVTPEKLSVVHDFKVNGYMSSAKPKQTYIESWPKVVRRTHVGQRNYKGVMINSGEYFESVNKVWANQMIMYAWMLGADRDFVVGIEQIACNPFIIALLSWSKCSFAPF